jgi:hypothetical protein
MPSNTKPFTVGMVIKSSTFSTHNGAFFGTAVDGDMYTYNNGSNLRLEAQNITPIFEDTIGLTDNTWYILVITYDSSGNWETLTNGLYDSATHNASFTAASTTIMGSRGGTAAYMDGYIAEIMKFSAVVSTSTIDTYLNNKWAVH